MQWNTTTVSIATVLFKKLVIVIATLGRTTLHWQLNKVIPSGMHNCDFKTIN